MELAVAILVFIIENYLKLIVLIAPICSLWKYYNSLRHIYIIILELILVLVVALIMFASLALTKMDCNRIANYFMLPVLLGLAYFDIAHYHRTSQEEADVLPFAAVAGEMAGGAIHITTNNDSKPAVADNDNGSSSIVDTIELTLTNGLGLMTIVQLAANSFRGKLSTILS